MSKVRFWIHHHGRESGSHHGFSTYRAPKGQAVHGDKDIRELLGKAGLPVLGTHQGPGADAAADTESMVQKQ